jgi:DNA-binding transcriptional ArsR family regulator
MSTVDPATLRQANVFAALGDPTRLALVGRLVRSRPQSIAALTAGTELTRQAVAKHLKVLETAGLVQARKSGREQHYTLQPERLAAAEAYLHSVSRPWDGAPSRLQTFLELGT